MTAPEAAPVHKWTYTWAEGSGAMRDVLGGKGAGLAEMARLGLPVPPGFTITTEACRLFNEMGGVLDVEVWEQVLAAVGTLEQAIGRRFGSVEHPLLVSVRSGAPSSMPGMMDTILNLGLNEEVVRGLGALAGERFALDAYRRLVQMFSKTVRGVDGDLYEAVLTAERRAAGVRTDAELDPARLRSVLAEFLAIHARETGEPFPTDPVVQLREAITAVFRSWNGPRAVAYRRHEGIADGGGTAVNVQLMVFGNMGETSGTGVVFSRDPNSGTSGLYGDFLLSAQGEDVVAGTRVTEPIASLARSMPEVHRELEGHAQLLERHYRDIQDIEFTIELGRLWLLQTRTAKRTGQAAVRAAVEMADEGLIERSTAIRRVDPAHLEQLLHPRIDPSVTTLPLERGVPASPGAVTGEAVFDPQRAVERAAGGRSVILVREVTSPEDVHGMIAARGVLTQSGGTLSHAAVVARGMGKPCIVGAAAVEVDVARRRFTAGGRVIAEGELITIDGGTGAVYAGEVPTVAPEASPELERLLEWADQAARLEVWANADYPRDALAAVERGARGIGLCRTEHMFMEEERLPVVRSMILAATTEEREEHLARLLPMQRADFEGILRAMGGRPVIIRLIDPPLHEFLPDRDAVLREVIEAQIRGDGGESLSRATELLGRIDDLREENPMMGLRGCRLSIVFPEVARMQVRAILEAATTVAREGVPVRPEIMIPLVGTLAETQLVRREIEATAAAIREGGGDSVPFHVGVMIEVPRAALVAGEIARSAEFFSFGTNDLTQMTFGYSRDDAERKFIAHYVETGVLPANPFETLDTAVVGLMEGAVRAGRAARPDLTVGICGEHGGDPASIHHAHRIGLDYVSCSPFRVPVARLAAAQAALEASQDVRLTE